VRRTSAIPHTLHQLRLREKEGTAGIGRRMGSALRVQIALSSMNLLAEGHRLAVGHRLVDGTARELEVGRAREIRGGDVDHQSESHEALLRGVDHGHLAAGMENFAKSRDRLLRNQRLTPRVLLRQSRRRRQRTREKHHVLIGRNLDIVATVTSVSSSTRQRRWLQLSRQSKV